MERLGLLNQGIVIAIIGMAVVFSGLLFLFVFMKLFMLITNRSEKKRQATMISRGLGKEPITGEVIAAISMAIHLSREEFHDLEKTIITLQRMTKPYSPWSSKIHGIRRIAR